MKRISLTGPVELRIGDDVMSFARGVSYDVADNIAKHPYLRQYIARVEDIAEPAKPKRPARKTKGTTHDEAVEH